jgi:hypothetical protein
MLSIYVYGMHNPAIPKILKKASPWTWIIKDILGIEIWTPQKNWGLRRC